MSTSSAGTFVTFGSQSASDGVAEPGAASAEPGAASAGPNERQRKQEPGLERAVADETSAAPVVGSHDGEGPQLAATSSVAAEAQQGEGPAAASASSSAVGESMVESRAVSVVVGPHGAAAACELGVVVVGPQGAAAASSIGVASAGPNGAAAAGNGANSSSVAIDSEGRVSYAPAVEGFPSDDLEERIAQLEKTNRELMKLVKRASARGGRKSGR